MNDIAKMRTHENIECNVQYQTLTEKHKTNRKTHTVEVDHHNMISYVYINVCIDDTYCICNTTRSQLPQTHKNNQPVGCLGIFGFFFELQGQRDDL